MELIACIMPFSTVGLAASPSLTLFVESIATAIKRHPELKLESQLCDHSRQSLCSPPMTLTTALHILTTLTCVTCWVGRLTRVICFGDLSTQIHHGRRNDPTVKSAWHTGAENSLLRLAVTLMGSRMLH
jgi:hypothetical protein